MPVPPKPAAAFTSNKGEGFSVAVRSDRLKQITRRRTVAPLYPFLDRALHRAFLHAELEFLSGQGHPLSEGTLEGTDGIWHIYTSGVTSSGAEGRRLKQAFVHMSVGYPHKSNLYFQPSHGPLENRTVFASLEQEGLQGKGRSGRAWIGPAVLLWDYWSCLEVLLRRYSQMTQQLFSGQPRTPSETIRHWRRSLIRYLLGLA